MKPTIPDSPDALLESGLHEHRAGRLDEAEAFYRRVLALEPQNPEALHLLGVVKTRRGMTREAVELISQAIALKPDVPKFQVNLGIAQRAAGDLPGAVASYQKAIALDPNLPEAHYNLGVAHEAQAELAAAEADFRQATELRADWVEALNNLGAVLRQRGKRDEALPFCEKAIALKPTFAEAHVNLASVLNDLRRHEDAMAAADRALALNPKLVIAHLARTTTLRMLGRLDEGVTTCRRALELNPDSADAHVHLGNLHLELAEFDEATRCFDRALTLKPDTAEAHVGKSLPRLLRGNLTDGFQGFEWWRKLHDARLRKLDLAKLWRGEDIAGRKILLHAEGGRGDTLNFIRYAALVKARGARVIVLCQDSLAALIETSPGVDQVVPESRPPPAYDVHAPLFGLPAIMGTTLETIPAKVPYLEPLPAAMFHLEAPRGTRLKVGLVWAGDLIHNNDHNRSLHAQDYAPFLALKNIAFYSLQVGPRAAEAKALKAANLIDLSPRLTDYSATAAAVAQLDLVITVDTSVCHLSGALARPTWTLLPFVPDWRWLWERKDSPWYPTMRLFRQPQRGDWNSVIEGVTTALAHLRDTPPSERPGFLSNQNTEANAQDRYRAFRAPTDWQTRSAITETNALREIDHLDEALARMEKALSANSSDADAWVAMGSVRTDRGEFDAAIESYDRALALQPDLTEAHVGRGNVLLLKGNLPDGFKEYDFRHRLKGMPRVSLDPKLAWKGEHLPGRTILLYGEGGRGDTLNFIRYARFVKQRGARVVVGCQPELVTLLKNVAGVDEILPSGAEVAKFDLHAPIFGLPGIFQTTLDTIPANVPYLTAPGADTLRLTAPCGTQLKVGLVWAGDPVHRNDRNRSMAAENYSPLLGLKDIAFYSLQVGGRARDLARVEQMSRVEDLSERLTDYSATAAAVAQLDLVITVDTSVCHLSGALARPTWTLLPFVPDWRWLWEREDSPWYPTMRLFRQPKRGDWNSVIQRVKAELTKLRDAR